MYKLIIYLTVFWFAMATGYTQLKCVSGDCENGVGVLQDTLGRKWEGKFVGGKLQGIVNLTTRAGFRASVQYEQGEIVAGVYKATHANGDMFEGSFSEGDRAKGKLIKKNGEMFEGDFQGDEILKGTYTYSDGRKYSGDFVSGKPQGNGNLTLPNSDTYSGAFMTGFFEGQGVYTWKEGGKYSGAWKQGRMEGQGTMEYKNGDKYVGAWKAGLRHGTGSLIIKKEGEDTKLNGEWYWGEFYGKKPAPTDKENRIAARQKKRKEKSEKAQAPKTAPGPQGQKQPPIQPQPSQSPDFSPFGKPERDKD